MSPKIINTQQEYEQYLSRLEEIFMAEKGTQEYQEALLLELLISDYEKKTYKYKLINPIDAIKIRLEEKNLKQKDLEKIIGTKSMVSEILNKKRKLNIEMIRKLHKFLDIPIEILVQDYSF
jgi:HTH-type transcriptional regulator/antitoxin HigA